MSFSLPDLICLKFFEIKQKLKISIEIISNYRKLVKYMQFTWIKTDKTNDIIWSPLLKVKSQMLSMLITQISKNIWSPNLMKNSYWYSLLKSLISFIAFLFHFEVLWIWLLLFEIEATLLSFNFLIVELSLLDNLFVGSNQWIKITYKNLL